MLIDDFLSHLKNYIRNQIYFIKSMKSPAFKSTVPKLTQNKTYSLTIVIKLGWVSKC